MNITQVVMGAMGCDRRAHYGNVEQPFCGKHGHYGQWPCPDAEVVAAALSAAGFGPVQEAWDEGYTTGNAHNGRRDANPYRKDT